LKLNSNTLFFGNKNVKNQKAQMIQTSFSFFNSNNGIRKRMEEMSKYYSGNNSNKNSGPVIVSYKNDIFSKDNNKNFIMLIKIYFLKKIKI
jgi:hypothetical protein